ncbi:Transcription factor like [Quillaja saponaria]|uniref:Transcription factor like n=1 Tax=Quillaja saponaria TaxID=32244 RepID=A0AAD7LER8_QUISA|nr:Transcription factor like [Quillaja saponaria]
MSSNRREPKAASKFTEDEIDELVSKLQALLPQLNQRTNSRVQASVSKILEETCSHIKRLQREVNGLSERLSRLIDFVDISDVDAETMRRFLGQ